MPRLRAGDHSAKNSKLAVLTAWRVVSMVAPVAVSPGCSAVPHVAMSGNDHCSDRGLARHDYQTSPPINRSRRARRISV
jgi:hypothetical protein